MNAFTKVDYLKLRCRKSAYLFRLILRTYLYLFKVAAFQHLLPALDLIFGIGEAPVTANTSIYKIDDEWLLYIESEGQLFLYGNYNKKLLSELSKRINIRKLEKYDIMGEYNCVYELLSLQRVRKYSVVKDRIFYVLEDPKSLLPALPNSIPSNEDIQELTQMMINYYEEEYKGTRNKTIDQILPAIVKHVATNTIHLFKEEDDLKAFCTIINPDIGIIFTKPNFRNQRIGRKLLSTCSRILFDLNNICYLMTDLNNPASNKLCSDLGYKEIYRHSNIEI